MRRPRSHLARARRCVRGLSILAFIMLPGCDDSKVVTTTLDASVPFACGAVGSTFGAIQRSIFEAHGCTSKGCHSGADAQGGLALTADVSYRNLIDVASHAERGGTPLLRVLPGGTRTDSLLYLKLAAATHDEPLPAGAGAPMPAGGAAPVPEEKLQALVLWILAGAPEHGVVKGTETLLDCELPEATPPPYTPLDPPPRAEGYQLHSPGWPLGAQDENEVCYATYYDLTDRAPADAFVACPEEMGGDKQRCVAYGDALMTQTAQSHHSNVYAYIGAADARNPAWGSWSCLAGELAGMGCDPTKQSISARDGGGDCGTGSACTSLVRAAPGCVGWGPPDFATKRLRIGGAQTMRVNLVQPTGVYGVIPARGIVAWNSHGFNLTHQASTVELSLNMSYAKASERRHLSQQIFDDGDVLSPHVAPFTKREFCRTLTLPRGARLQFLVGHMHKRGKLFRIWDPPRTPCKALDAACVAPAEEPIYVSRHYDDQTVLFYDDTPRAFDQEDPNERTLLYCALYDNGADDATTVKRKSTSVKVPGGLAPGGPCADAELVCLGGDHQGQPCAGDDSVCAGGVCDACPVKGGVTTDDEMLLLLGGYHVVEPSR